MAEINIIGMYRGKREEIDTADTEQEANKLVAEYRLALGRDWTVWTETEKDTP